MGAAIVLCGACGRLIRLGWFFVNHASQFGSQPLDFSKLLLHSIEKCRLRFDSFFNQKACGFRTVAKDSGLDQLFNLLLRAGSDFYSHDVIILRGNRAFDGAADIAANSAQ